MVDVCHLYVLALGRTLIIIVGGAKRYYITVEQANLNYFIFYTVKNGIY
jgi:hypothetical protein